MSMQQPMQQPTAEQVLEAEGREIAPKSKSNRNTWIAACSNLSTAYNLVNVNLAHVVMQNEYCGGDFCPNEVTTVGTACLAGAIIGQLTFGYVGDCLGRGRALTLTMILTIAGALLSAFAVPLTSDPRSVFAFISAARFTLGIGVGGVYPLAATIASESADDTNRGRMVSLVFSMQGVGTVLVPLIGMICLYGFGTYEGRVSFGQSVPGIAWRLILGLGALPGMILLCFPAATKPQGNSTGMTFWQALGKREYWRSLIGCAGGWFLFDITFYGNTLFAPTVLQAAFGRVNKHGYTPTIGDTLGHNLCLQLLILALIGLPGYYLSVLCMDRFGRKTIQLQGFAFMALFYAGLGFFFIDMQQANAAAPLLVIYGLTYFFSNFGPNSTTFILPSESFPFEVRSSLNGFCAAMGKLGATVGSAIFKPVVDSSGPETVFWLCTACALIGVVVTGLCIDDRRGRGMKGTSFIRDEEGRTITPPTALV